MSEKDYPPGFEEDAKNIAIDFDGVIHNFDKGFHDGTCYGDPLPGSLEALKKISESYNIIIFTAKAKPSRPLVNGKTGTELIWAWLKENDLDQYVSKVSAEKPRAVAYVDDKGISFNSWDKCLEALDI